MCADWMDESHGPPPVWQNPHQRSYYREQVAPSHASFHPTMHPNSNVGYPNSFTGMSAASEEKHSRLQDSLDKVLGPEYVQTRPGGGGTKLTYLEGWRAINLANEVFGYNGWFTDIKFLETDFCEENPQSGRWSMGVTAIVRVRLPDGASHEDVGYGKLENAKSKGDGLDKCKKEAVTDALKRALRHFGKLLGNCLYDKSYLSQLSAMKAQKPKFDWDSIYKPEHHALYAPDPKYIATRAKPPGIDASSMPPPPIAAKSSSTTTAAAPPVDRPPPPHPPHMQRSRTVGSSSVPVQMVEQKPAGAQIAQRAPAPQRSKTVSHAAPLAPPDRALTASAVDYALYSDDEHLFAGMDLGEGEGEDAIDEAAATEPVVEDSGFVEASFLQEVKARPPQPPDNSSSSPHDETLATRANSIADQKRQIALAKLEKTKEAKARAQARQQQQHPIPPQNTATVVSSDISTAQRSTTSAAQLLKAQPLRPPVPPSRSNSIVATTAAPSAPIRQAGTLPTLHVGHGIAQAHAVASAASSALPASIPPPSITGTPIGPGFVTARGVKRQPDDP
ncbi:uncharacterized protein JCM15063_005808 [Sporobolomyces koalae]|uniref:uncharacterized protein n=1 Tax=Sporobolomyces koalae TaxID=500713 RepID=UPI00317F52BE